MNDNLKGGNGKRPPGGRSAPDTTKRTTASKGKQVQRPTPSKSDGQKKVNSKSDTDKRSRDIPKGSVNVTGGKQKKRVPNNRPTKSEAVSDLPKKARPTADKKPAAKKGLPPQKNEVPAPRIVTPPKEPVNPYIKKIRRFLLATATIAILIVICVGVSLKYFFKIDEITVEGKTRYNNDDIIAASMIKKGDNLIMCDTSLGEDKIQKKFSYIEEVDIEKKPFNKINIKVTEAKPTYVVENNGKYLVLGKSGKIIEINSKNAYKDIPEILGAKLKNVKLSSKIQYNDKNLPKYLDKLVDNIGKYKITGVKTIDISDMYAVKLIKNSGFTIIIGNFENIEYKLETAARIISDNVRENVTGTLDVSLASSDSGKSYLKIGSADVSKTSSSPLQESSKTSEVSKDKEKSDKPEESSEESVAEETSTSEEDSYSDNSYTDDGYTDDGYTDDGYTDDGYTDDGYTDDGYTDDGYTDDGYTDDGYTDDGYTDDGYTDDGYTDDDYTDDGYTDDGYTDDGYTDDGYTDDGYTDDGYTDDGYTDDGYTDDGYTDDGYTDDGYTDDGYY